MEVKSHVSRSVAIHQYKKSLTASAVLLMQKSLGIIGGLHVDTHISSFDRECAKNVILYIRTHISIKCLLKSYSLHTGTPPLPPNDHNHKFMHSLYVNVPAVSYMTKLCLIQLHVSLLFFTDHFPSSNHSVRNDFFILLW